MPCRLCKSDLDSILDLGHCPPSNAFLKKSDLIEPEIYFPLVLCLCSNCWLLQIRDQSQRENFFSEEYAYFSSFSRSFLDQCKTYAKEVIAYLGLDANSNVIEIGSNDGYLLQYFKEFGMNVLGVEPTKSTAFECLKKGIPVENVFFGKNMAEHFFAKDKAELMIANNVLAHVPDPHDFVAGLSFALAKSGVITAEFPHVLKMIEGCQFDTIYHEHYSYLSLSQIIGLYKKHKLKVFRVDELSSHGGSLRVYACHEDYNLKVEDSVDIVLTAEADSEINTFEYYHDFIKSVARLKISLLSFLLDLKKNEKTCVAYGAAAKGNSLFNYCGIKNDLIPFVVDKSPHKQNLYLPGSHIPVVEVSELFSMKPDYVLVLPWNLRKEISEDLNCIRDWGGKFVVAIPSLEIF